MNELSHWSQCLHSSTWVVRNYLTRTSPFIWNLSFQTFDLADHFLIFKYFSFLILRHCILLVFLLPIGHFIVVIIAGYFYLTVDLKISIFSGPYFIFSSIFCLNSIPTSCDLVLKISVLFKLHTHRHTEHPIYTTLVKISLLSLGRSAVLCLRGTSDVICSKAKRQLFLFFC